MSLIAKDKGGAQMDPIAPGVYAAVCYGVVDLGTQFNAKFNKEERKVLVQWELPDCRAEFQRDGQMVNLPRATSRRYTLSLSVKAALRRDLESWRGRKFTEKELEGFDLKAILGAACQIQMVQETGKDGRVFSGIAAIMALPKGAPRRKPENPLMFFTFDEAGPNPVLPAEMPDWIRKIVCESREWRNIGAAPQPASTPAAAAARPAAPAETSDDLPF